MDAKKLESGSVEWLIGEKDWQKCPSCQSSNVDEDRDSADGFAIGWMYCKDCGFKGKPYNY